MRKAAFLAVVLFFTACSFGTGERHLANEGKAGLYAKSIDRVLRMDDNHVDLATASLLVSQHWNPNLNIPRYRGKIDEMAWVIKDRMIQERTGRSPAAIAIINDYLYKELKFKAVSKADDPLDLFLDSVVDRRQGYCLSLSILYLSLAERLNLPIYGVVVPGHFFVRYDDGKNRFNIETTSDGATPPDSHYIEKFKITGKEPDSAYLKNLTKVQTLGCLFNNLGNLYQEANNVNAAQWSLEAAVEINPSLALSHTNLGNVYLKQGNFDKAVAEYKQALHTSDDDAKTHNNLGNAMSSIGRYADAVREYKKAIDLDPNLTEAYRNIAGAYRQTGEYEQAVLTLKKAIEFERQSNELYAQLGETYAAMQDYDKAIPMYVRSLNLKSDATVSTNLAYAYMQKGQLDYAIEQFTIALRQEPLNANLYYGIAQAYNKLGKFDEEIAAYKQAIAINPKMANALLNLGNVYQEKKMYDAAIKEYKKALAAEPNDARLYYNLGVAYARLDKHAEAAKQFVAAIAIEPKFSDAHAALAVSCYMLKKYDVAWDHAKTAKKLGYDVPKDLYEELYRRTTK
jgi:tetratricopeptide (TPR) repeat protein